MKVAVQNPYFLLEDPSRNFNGYNYEFVRQFKPVIYLTQPQIVFHLQKGMRANGLNPQEFAYAYSVEDLNRLGVDVLLCFNGRQDLPDNAPPREFNGLKIYHVMDYVFHATQANQALVEGGADYVMGYANHGAYCPFFQRFYPSFADRVVSVPFGFGPRFEVNRPLEDRIRKVIALGAVNPVDDPMVKDRQQLIDYITFYQDVPWTHQWRRMLVEHEAELVDVMHSQLPVFPETKNSKYNAVNMMALYAMFANDEGLMAFPPARTYEGTAAGSVLVCSDHPSYAELGFADGVNCIMHEKHNLADFRDKVRHYQEHPQELARLAANSTMHVRNHYSHAQVARSLQVQIEVLWETK